MATGRVKWFNDLRGYGFIECDEGGDDVYVHYTALSSDGYQTLKQGTRVVFDVEPEARGPRACRVVVVVQQ